MTLIYKVLRVKSSTAHETRWSWALGTIDGTGTKNPVEKIDNDTFWARGFFFDRLAQCVCISMHTYGGGGGNLNSQPHSHLSSHMLHSVVLSSPTS